MAISRANFAGVQLPQSRPLAKFRSQRNTRHSKIQKHSPSAYSYIETNPRSYIEGRLKILKAETRAIFSVASYASQAADWLMHVPKPEGRPRKRKTRYLTSDWPR